MPPQVVPSPAQGLVAREVVDGEHVPLLAARLQASHCPSQATLQQTLSAQTLLAHSLDASQRSPLRRPTQVPLSQIGVLPVQVPQQDVTGMHVPLQSLVWPAQPALVPDFVLPVDVAPPTVAAAPVAAVLPTMDAPPVAMAPPEAVAPPAGIAPVLVAPPVIEASLAVPPVTGPPPAALTPDVGAPPLPPLPPLVYAPLDALELALPPAAVFADPLALLFAPPLVVALPVPECPPTWGAPASPLVPGLFTTEEQARVHAIVAVRTERLRMIQNPIVSARERCSRAIGTIPQSLAHYVASVMAN